MLAMESPAPLGVRCPALSLATIASLLAPTEEWVEHSLALHPQPLL